MLCVGMQWGRSASSMSGGDAERLGIALPTQSVGTMAGFSAFQQLLRGLPECG
jgi:hypothetical protein